LARHEKLVPSRSKLQRSDHPALGAQRKSKVTLIVSTTFVTKARLHLGCLHSKCIKGICNSHDIEIEDNVLESVSPLQQLGTESKRNALHSQDVVKKRKDSKDSTNVFSFQKSNSTLLEVVTCFCLINMQHYSILRLRSRLAHH
jgi:hypothetical protein